jgi:putative ABC transport system permease protein
MRWLKLLHFRLYGLLFKNRIEREMDEELRFHVQMRILENVRRGMSYDEARIDAVKGFGNLTRIKEACRDIRGGGLMETMLQDLRYGARMLIKKPGFAAVAVLTLALGIGANTAIFSVVNAVLLRPLPYREPGRLVEIWETNPIKGWTDAPAAPANYFDWDQQNDVFEGMAAHWPSPGNLALMGMGEPERLRCLGATGNLFTVLGVEPALGRTFLPEETWEGNNMVVVLSHGLWVRRFDQDVNIIGRPILLDGQSYTVVGVMPDDFYFPTKEVELWVPWGWNPTRITSMRRPHFARVVARLKSGVTLERARTEMDTIASRLEQQYPGTNTKMGVGLGLLHEWTVSDTRLPLLILLAAVGFILMIACANIANLLLSRAATRMKEIAIRTALGAGRLRLVRQLLTESLLMSVAGSALGLLLAVWGKDLLLAFSPGSIPRFDEISIDGRVLVFTLGITFLTTVFFGLVPSLAGSKLDLTISLKEGGQKQGGAQHNRSRSLFVILEVAFALVLLIGAGLMIKSFVRLRQVNPGFDPSNILALRVSLPESKYKEDPQAIDFFQQALERIKNLPGVKAAGATSVPPLKGSGWTSDFTIEGRPPEEYGKEVRHKEISPDYFRAIGVPLLSGRLFTDSDNADKPVVIIINQTLARRYFSGEDPIGKRLRFGRPDQEEPWYTIVGVAGDEKQDGLGIDVKPEIYQSYLQSARSGMTLIVRAEADPKGLIGAVRGELWGVDKEIPVYDIKTMQEVLYESVARERFTVLLLTIFAAVALILSAAGIYSVMSYSVAQRTHEIGIRMALGAQVKDVLKLVVRQAMMLALTGVLIGLAGAFALTRLISNLLYDVSVTDPATFGLISLLLVGVALLACLIPARRATRVDPMIALRYE